VAFRFAMMVEKAAVGKREKEGEGEREKKQESTCC
jgi:hypothetical protein